MPATTTKKRKRDIGVRDGSTGRFMSVETIEARGRCHCGAPREDEDKRTCRACRKRASAFSKRRAEAKREAKVAANVSARVERVLTEVA